MNTRIYGLFWLLAPSLFLISSTPRAAGQTGFLQFGSAKVTASDLPYDPTSTSGIGPMISETDATLVGNKVLVVAPSADAAAEAFPSDNDNFAFAYSKAGSAPGHDNQGPIPSVDNGAADATSDIFYEVEDNTGQVVPGVVHMNVQISASALLRTASLSGGRAGAAVNIASGPFSNPIFDASVVVDDNGGVSAFGDSSGQTISKDTAYSNNLGLSVSVTKTSFFSGTIDFNVPTGDFHVEDDASVTTTGMAVVDPTFSLADPNLKLVSLSPINPDPGAQLPSAREISALTAAGVDLSGFVATGLISVPEPSTPALFALGLLAMAVFWRGRSLRADFCSTKVGL